MAIHGPCAYTDGFPTGPGIRVWSIVNLPAIYLYSLEKFQSDTRKLRPEIDFPLGWGMRSAVFGRPGAQNWAVHVWIEILGRGGFGPVRIAAALVPGG